MDQLFEIAVLAIISLGLVYRLNFARAERKNVKDVWQAYATASGWQVLPRPEPAMEADAAIVIVGAQDSRLVEVAAYRRYLSRRRPEYMEMKIDLDNTVGFVIKSGFGVRLLRNEGGQPHLSLDRVKSGDRNFDSSYRIKGYPKGMLHKLLTSRDVQTAIRKIYPTSTLFVHTAHFQVQGDKLALRVEKLYYNEERLRKFIEQGCALAEAIEKSMRTD